ncbi:uncharacterized protein [Littorina saxatilis]|uniref:uncharacterized protein isoform X2 n=1 Tax=Littorina saxatilis TaxID=31220 RepID=UPI0038B45223
MPSACPTWLLAIFTLFSTGARVQAQAETRPSLTQALPVESQCSYSGLFVPESDLSLNANGGLFFEGDTLFGLTKYKRQFVYNETCDYVKVTRPKAANRVQLQECSAPTYSTLPQQVTTSRHTRSSTCKSCCKTWGGRCWCCRSDARGRCQSLYPKPSPTCIPVSSIRRSITMTPIS